MKSESKKIGRPTAYQERFCSDLIEHMKQGLSFESFAGVCGVSKETIYTWTEKHPDFLDSKKVGTELSRLFWEKLGIQNIINESESQHAIGSSSKSLNATVWIFNMKNRFGWRDKQPEEITQIHVEQNAKPLDQAELIEAIKKARLEK